MFLTQRGIKKTVHNQKLLNFLFMKNSKNKSNRVLKIIGVIGVILYLLFLVGEKAPLFNNASFFSISIYLLFLIFLLGILFLWKNVIVAGIICIFWYAIQWALVLCVWPDGGATLVLGFPITIFGIVVLIIGIIQKRKK
jgi:hypothetical protein